MSCQQPQMKVDQTPRFEQMKKKRKSNGNQVISKIGVIRPDRRKKTRFL